ncbi:MAG: PIG-L family deacetylase [Planctomycetota bacterium]
MANVLVVGPHPDDQELGMGGTIARLAAQGHDVLLVDVTNGEPTPHGSPEQRAVEAARAAEILSPEHGPPLRRHLMGLPNRSVEHTLEARHSMAAVIRAHRADVVFTPYFEDAHPDHRAVTRIVEDARFDAKLTKLDLADPVDGWTGHALPIGEPVYPKWLFYYYATHLRWLADPSFLIDVTGEVDRKIASIEAYETQFVIPEKNRRVVGWIRSAMDYMGSRIGVEAAEGFFTKEPIGLWGLDGLV